MPSAASGEALCHLQETLAKLDPGRAFLTEDGVLPLGLPGVDGALAGGLACGALHELAPAGPGQIGATFGFALALAARAAQGGGSALLIQTDFAAIEAGALYGLGLDRLGLPLERVLILRVPRVLDALWAFEEALKSHALAAVLAELPEDGADLTATRRLALAARAGGGLGLLLRHRRSPLASAAMTRWEVAAALSAPDRFGGLGRSAFDLSLRRNRRGHGGRFIVCWDHETASFVPQALSFGMAAAARDGSAEPLARARTA
ncbi:MAG: protein ImuA [Alphaproteobacteria bacterium]|jgi:protein ImuA|nr:protein ImuA [Alphaproteobacteria bacterium]